MRKHNVKTRHGVFELRQSHNVHNTPIDWNMVDSDHAGVKI
jgi:hypothetical protein